MLNSIYKQLCRFAGLLTVMVVVSAVLIVANTYNDSGYIKYGRGYHAAADSFGHGLYIGYAPIYSCTYIPQGVDMPDYEAGYVWESTDGEYVPYGVYVEYESGAGYIDNDVYPHYYEGLDGLPPVCIYLDYAGYIADGNINGGYIGITPFTIIPAPLRINLVGRPPALQPPNEIRNLVAGQLVPIDVDFRPGYSAGSWACMLMTMFDLWGPTVGQPYTNTTSRAGNPLITYYHAMGWTDSWVEPPIIYGDIMVNFVSVQVGMDPVRDLNDSNASNYAIIHEIAPNISNYTLPVSIRNLRPSIHVAPLYLEMQPNTNSNLRYFTLDIPGAGSPVFSYTTDFVAPAVNITTPGLPATANNLPFNVAPRTDVIDPGLGPAPGLGPGSFSNMVYIAQRRYDRAGNLLPDVNPPNVFTGWAWLNTPRFAPNQGGTLNMAVTNPTNNPLQVPRGEFEITFKVYRAAEELVITTAEGPGRAAAVHVGYTYRNPNPLPDSYPYTAATPGFSYSIINLPHSRDVEITIPPPRYTFFDYDVVGMYRRPVLRVGGRPRLPITPPPGYIVICARVDDSTDPQGNPTANYGNLIVRLRPVSTVTFILNGGQIAAVPSPLAGPIIRNNRLQGCFIQLGDGNAVTGHPVAGLPWFDTATNPQRGVPQPDPTREGFIFRGWREVSAAGSVLNPAAAPLTSQNVAGFRVTAGNRYFRAEWELDLYFIKTGERLYELPTRVIEPRDGAVFQIWGRNAADTGWDLVRTTSPSGSAAYGSIDGRIVLHSIFANYTTVDLLLRYKLIETVAPAGYAVPGAGSHWYLNVLVHGGVNTGVTITFDEQSSAPYFVQMLVPAGLSAGLCCAYSYMAYAPVPYYYEIYYCYFCNFYEPYNSLCFCSYSRYVEISEATAYDFVGLGNGNGLVNRWHVGNLPAGDYVEIPVYKTDWGIYATPRNVVLLPGARFHLYRFTGTGPLPAGALVPHNWAAGGDWYRVAIEISQDTPGSPMIFPMTPDNYYHLVERIPPSGYQALLGQWRLQVVANSNAPLGYDLIQTPVGGYMPEIVWYSGAFHIGNRPDFDLPLTGGAGMVLFHIAGAVVVGAAGLSLFVFVDKKRSRSI